MEVEGGGVAAGGAEVEAETDEAEDAEMREEIVPEVAVEGRGLGTETQDPGETGGRQRRKAEIEVEVRRKDKVKIIYC